MDNALRKFFDDQVRPLADQQPKAAREQIAKAFEDAPADADGVDPWFLEHFHKAPVSHDTRLFNQLQGMKAAIRDAFTPKPAAAQ